MDSTKIRTRERRFTKKNSPYSELPGHGELSARILKQAPLPLQTETQTKQFIRDYSVHVIDLKTREQEFCK